MTSRLIPKRARRYWRIRRLRHGLWLGILIAGVTGALIAGRFFTQTRLAFTNVLYTPLPLSPNTVIVAIDDLSLGAYGRSVVQWPRRLHGELLDQLAKAGARTVAFDILFAEPTDDDARFAEAIRRARDSEARTRTILAFVGQGDPDVQEGVLRYSKALFPVSVLRDAAEMIAHVNVLPDPDSTIRRLPVAIRADGKIWYSFSVAAYLQYLRIPGKQADQLVRLNTDQQDARQDIAITTQRTIPVDGVSQALINFFGPADSFPIYSYKRVHDGEIDPNRLKDKIVLVGFLNGAGVTDYYNVPISAHGEAMSGIEVHANMLETLLQNRPLHAISPLVEGLLIVFLSLCAGLFFSQLGRYWSIAAFLGALALVFLGASMLFTLFGEVLSILYPFLALTLLLVGTLFANIRLEILQRRQVQTLLNSATRLIEQRLLLDDLLKAIASEIAKVLDASNPMIWLWDEEQGRLHLAFPKVHATPDNTTIDKALKQGELIQQDNTLALPLSFQNRPLGVVATEGRHPQEKVALLEMFGEQIGPAIANARLYTNQVQQRELLEVFLKSVPNPLLVLDANQQIIRANPSAQTLLQVEHIDGFREAVRALDLPADILQTIETALGQGDPFHLEIQVGKQVFVLQGSPLSGVRGGWVLSLNDITSLKDLDTFKTQMIRMASHDIKNPIGVIIGYSEMLLEEPMDEEQRRFVEIILESAKRTLALTSDLLNLERIRAANLELAPLDLWALVEEVAHEYKTQVHDKGQTLEASGEALMVNADRSQLREAISNLIGNAIKYTPPGGSIHIRATVEANRKARVMVRDTGLGIPQEALGRLFQPFFRVKSKATVNIPGTGLGLHLTKTVIENHRGRIWVESQEKVGSSFFFELPLL